MSARDDLARLIFITDNKGAKDPDAEWTLALTLDAEGYTMTAYAYAIADGLLAAGVTMPEVPVAAWTSPPPFPKPDGPEPPIPRYWVCDEDSYIEYMTDDKADAQRFIDGLHSTARTMTITDSQAAT